MTAPPRTPVRDRSLPAVVLGVLAVLASLLTGAGTPVAAAASPATAAVAAVRGVAQPAPALRAGKDPRAGQRRATRERAGTTASTARLAGIGHGPAPVTVVLLAALLTVLVAGALATRRRPARGSRRTAMVRRDRAPPVLALA